MRMNQKVCGGLYFHCPRDYLIYHYTVNLVILDRIVSWMLLGTLQNKYVGFRVFLFDDTFAEEIYMFADSRIITYRENAF